MKVIKPLRQGLLFKPYSHAGSHYLCVAIFSFFNFDNPRALLMESEMWPFLAGELGNDVAFEACMPKGQAELLLNGSCYAPRDGSPRHSVRIAMGGVDKELAVCGERVWLQDADRFDRLMGRKWLISDPKPFSQIPLDWQHAFGGSGFARNPLGLGYLEDDAEPQAAQWLLPNVENPAQLMDGPWAQPEPAGVGMLDIMWPQRLGHAGTYDQNWLDNYAPGLPPDLDFSYFNTAPQDQRIEDFWSPDQEFHIWGMHPDEELIQGQLPGLRSRCFVTRLKEGKLSFEELSANIDTVWLFPHAKKGITVHRAQARVERFDATDLQHMLLAYEYMDGEARSEAQYKKSLARRLSKKTRLFWEPREDDISPPEKAPGDDYQPPDPKDDPRVRAILAEAKQEAQKNLDQVSAQVAALGLDGAGAINKEEILAKFDNPDLGGLRLPPPFKTSDDLPRMMKYLQGEWARFKAESEPMSKLGQTVDQEIKQGLDQMNAKLKAGLGDHLPNLDEAIQEARQKPAPRPVVPQPEEGMAGEIKNAMAKLDQLDKLPGDFRPPEMEQKMAQALKQAEKADKLFASLGMGKNSKGMEAAAAAFLPDPPPRTGEELDEMRTLVIEAHASGKGCKGWDLTGADLSKLTLPGLDLNEAVLDSADLSDSDLSGAQMDQACLVRTRIDRTLFKGALLSKASLSKAKGSQTDFTGADLSGAFLAGVNLSAANFSRAKLTQANCLAAGLEQCDLSGCDLTKAILMEARLNQACFAAADLSEAMLMNTKAAGADFGKAVLCKTTFAGTSAPDSSFIEADLDKVRMVNNTDLSGSDFSSCRSRGGNWRGSSLKGSLFSGADLQGSDFSDCDLSAAVLQGVVLKSALMMKTRLEDADLSGSDLMLINLMGARLIRTDLRYANLFQANGIYAQTQELRLEEANIKRSMLKEDK